jgi:fluoride exporter
MLVWIAVGAGGALGSLARHAVNRLVQHEWPLLRFPLATAVVNIAGCAVIGLLAGLIASGRLPMRQPWREFVFVGVLGGFTTFSTFGFETISLVRTGEGAHLRLRDHQPRQDGRGRPCARECGGSGDRRAGRRLRGTGGYPAPLISGRRGARLPVPWRTSD